MADFNVGDTLYFEKFGSLSYAQKIEKVNKKTLLTKHHTIHYDGDKLELRNQGRWQTISVRKETPELKAKMREIFLRRWYADNWSKATLEEIEVFYKKHGDEE